jgi:integrase
MPRGRRKGSANRGYFFRAGRGWFAKVDGKQIPLQFENGERMRAKSTSAAELKAAHRRLLSNGNGKADDTEDVADDGPSATVMQVCQAYLDKVEDSGSKKTYKDRSETLFDFCTGFPPRFKGKSPPTPKDRIHPGYGGKLVHQLRPLDIDQWLAKHKTWKGGRRSRVQAVKRALNYGAEAGLIAANPIKGYKVARQNARVTYITPEQEAALLAEANPFIGVAIKVGIRTGARPGCEFAALTAQHVKDYGDKMEWVFQASEAKTKRLRTIRITDPDMMRIVREQIADHKRGTVFRNTKGEAWTRESLSLAFRYVRKRCEKQGVEFDNDTCMYSCRHTFAKRILQGFWTGKQINIETLARVMGNSPQVCRDHYLQWADTYNEPLWEAV